MLGAFIRTVRESRGLTQEELAITSGVSQPNLSAYERDRRAPTADTLNRLLVACGYELAAVAGEATVFAPLPIVGWYPDEDLPRGERGDPMDEAPTVTPATPMAERVAAITAVLELAEATR